MAFNRVSGFLVCLTCASLIHIPTLDCHSLSDQKFVSESQSIVHHIIMMSCSWQALVEITWKDPYLVLPMFVAGSFATIAFEIGRRTTHRQRPELFQQQFPNGIVTLRVISTESSRFVKEERCAATQCRPWRLQQQLLKKAKDTAIKFY